MQVFALTVFVNRATKGAQDRLPYACYLRFDKEGSKNQT
jgi:hypothetical protein